MMRMQECKMISCYKSQVRCDKADAPGLYDSITRILSISGDYQNDSLGGGSIQGSRLMAYQPKNVAAVIVSDDPDLPLISIQGRSKRAVRSRADDLGEKLSSLGLNFSEA